MPDLVAVVVAAAAAVCSCQVDRQAEDRCHRLGQTRPVWVHRMVLKGTVDNNIYQIAQRKLRLDKEVLEVRTDLTDKQTRNRTVTKQGKIRVISGYPWCVLGSWAGR